MRFTWLAKSFVLLVVLALLVPGTLLAQSVVTGGISGTVTDPSGAVVPNAKLTLKNAATGAALDTVTSSTGLYNFPLLKPGAYTVSIAQSGFRGVSQKVDVLLGQTVMVNIKLAVGNASETVEVTGTAPLLQTEDANITTTYTSVQIDNLPSPGGDITNYAQTAPGVLMNTEGSGGGYGNFSAFGLPATSNLFTLNGNDENDPFLNLNNSGSSNLLLGQNEVQEVAVVSNGYTAQYGRQAGVQVDYSTKSGSNDFHGNASWWYDTSGLNANEWFLKSGEVASGVPGANKAPFAIANQWAGSIGGPIVKDKLFFYVDQEGLRYSLPSVGRLFIPTPAFATQILSNIAATQPAQSTYYSQLMSLYAHSPSAAAAYANTGGIAAFDPTGGGCGDYAGTASLAPGGLPFGGGAGTQPCLATTEASGVNHNKEWLLTTRIDYNISSADKLFGRFKVDHGSQPTSTDLINPTVFSTMSIQPEYEGQINETHVFSPTMVNNLIISGLWYSAIFLPDSGQAAVLSTLGMSSILFGPNLLSTLGGNSVPDYIFPQGRNSTMYQITDDLSITKGAHTFKAGINFRRDDLSDHDNQIATGGLAAFTSLTNFVNGTPSIFSGDIYEQVFTSAPNAPLAFYSMGLYFQDEWRVNSNLKLTLALRGDRNSNAVCQSDCYARLATPFSSMAHNPLIPYNQVILANQHNAFDNIEKVALQPRLGFTYSPKGFSNTVLRGGIGVFSDLYQGVLLDSLIGNSPTTNLFLVFPGLTGPNPLAPTVAGSMTNQAGLNNSSFLSQFATGGTLGTISATNPAFQPPNYFSVANHINNPKYLEWNFEIQQAIGTKMSVNLNYVGTHGYDILIQNPGLNGFINPLVTSTYFGQTPFAAPDPRFGTVDELSSIGRSNYDGLVASFTRRMSYGFQMSANYTFSHSLDDVTSTSPGTPYSGANSIVRQIDPYNFDYLSYGPSDSDSRHNFTANYVWNMPHRFQNRLTELALGGWGVAGTFFAHSGTPWSAVTTEPQILNNNGSILASFLGGPEGNCSTPGSNYAVSPNHCYLSTQFAPFGPGGQFEYGNVSRNFFRAPHYFDTDFSLMKNFLVTERVKFQLGANMFNVLNHPSFAAPINQVASPQFGQLASTLVQPTTPYGAYQGAGVSGRLIQVQAKLIF